MKIKCTFISKTIWYLTERDRTLFCPFYFIIKYLQITVDFLLYCVIIKIVKRKQPNEGEQRK
jgi:hypothetical protein